MSMVYSKSIRWAFGLLFTLTLVSCNATTDSSTATAVKDSITASGSNTGVTSANTAMMGARIYLRNADTHATYTNASFHVTESSGFSSCTSAAPCTISADTYFSADGQNTPLQGTPAWISSVKVGVTAAPAATAACAKFNSYNESAVTTSLPDMTGGTTSTAVQGENGYYRVSEYDCNSQLLTSQTGYASVASEPIQVQVNLNRTYLGSAENIMATIEYSAFAVNPELNGAGLGTSGCLTAISGNPLWNSSCAIFLWQFFAFDSSTTTTPSPFMTVIPPVAKISSAIVASASNGSLVQTRQIIVPLSALGKAISTLQLSRTKSNFSADSSTCTNSNSPLCDGTVLYSITLYRM